LRCCLVYEYEQYVEARQKLPKKNKRIGTPFGEAKVVDVFPLSDSVLVYIEEHGLQTIKREEIVPLEELEALAKKAKEPCTVHGDEGCDCGAKPPKVKAEVDAVGGETVTTEADPEEDEASTMRGVARSEQSASDQSHRPRQRKRGDRKRGESGDRPQSPTQGAQAEAKPQGERKDRPPRSERSEGGGQRRKKNRSDRRPKGQETSGGGSPESAE